MKFRRARRKPLTLMIIPEADQNIVRFRLPIFGLYAVPALMTLVVTASGMTVYGMHNVYQRSSAALQEQYDSEERRLAETIIVKTEELEKLQLELIGLSDQTEQFKSRLEQIKQLEQSLESLTGGASSPSAAAMDSDRPMGGALTPVKEDESLRLASQTKSELTAMQDEIDTLIGQLSDSRTKLAEAEHVRRITPSVWPTTSRVITSGYGLRVDPFSSRPSFHSGLDIAGKSGDPVVATADGIVRAAGWHDDYGNYVRIDHGNGIETFYFHMSAIMTEKGKAVVKGQQIGRVGSTGRSTGNHLHYEVHKNNVEMNPIPYLKFK